MASFGRSLLLVNENGYFLVAARKFNSKKIVRNSLAILEFHLFVTMTATPSHA